MSDDDDDYDLDEIFPGILNIITIGIGLLLLPGSINLVTVHLMRQLYTEKRQTKKRQ
jgi:hypothetical protein